MKLIKVNEFPHEIVLEDSNICISIYMPTHRHISDNNEDQTRLKNLIKEVKKSLLKVKKVGEIEEILKPLYGILENPYFWNSIEDGLVILLNEEGGVYYTLNREVEEFTLVAKEFYIKPLIRNFQSYDQYHILALSKDEFKLFEGNRYSIKEINLGEDVITKKTELLEGDNRGKVINFGTYTGTGHSYHGHNTVDEGIEKETTQFFRYVDDFIYKEYSLIENIPLILWSLPESQGEFRKITKNRFLLEEGINQSLTSIQLENIQEKLWKLIEPLYLNKTHELLNQFNEEMAKGRTSIDILEIAHGLSDGRVDTLIVEDNKIIPGIYDKEDRKIIEGNLKNPKTGDLINQLTLMTFAQQGDVVVLPKEKMPENRGVMAIFRY